MCEIDMDGAGKSGVLTIPAAREMALPDWVQSWLDQDNISLVHGTVVVWNKPDRLTRRKVETLKQHLIETCGVIYRYLLGSVPLVEFRVLRSSLSTRCS